MTQQQHNVPRALRRAEASEYLRFNWQLSCAPTTLAKLATIGGGPPFAKAGRFPVYPIDALDAWARAKISPLVNSTAGLKMQRSA